MKKHTSCKQHEWKNDPMFEDGTVVMEFNFKAEMRQYCINCNSIRYIPKSDSGNSQMGLQNKKEVIE